MPDTGRVHDQDPDRLRLLRRGLGARGRAVAVEAWERLRTYRVRLQCVAVLTCILVTTLGLAWLAWLSTVDRSVQLEQPSVTRGAESSLVADNVRRRSDGVTEARSSGSARSAGDGSAPAAPALTVDAGVMLSGKLVATGSVLAMLVVGALVARLALRGLRRDAALSSELAEPVREERVSHEDADADRAEDDPLGSEACVVDDLPEPCAASSTLMEQPGEAAATALVAFDQPGVEAGGRPLGTSLGLEEPGIASSSSLLLDGAAPFDSRNLQTQPTRSPVGALLTEPAGHREGQRVFERRAAPRVHYVQPAHLTWGELEAAVTVLDLSESGLRCRVDAVQLKVTAPPKAGDFVRISFPADGGQVHVKAQVAWRRQAPEGPEIGVQFVSPPQEAADRIRATCLRCPPT